MAPHVVPVESRCGNKPSTDLKKFAVTRNGFLPAERPSELLSDPYYEPWELVAQHLPQLIDEDRIRDEVSKLPVLETHRLLSEAEWRRAYVVLAYIAHAYIWGGEKPEEILPPQITLPFLRVSSHLELPPVLTYAAANLWNFSSPGLDFTNLEDLRTLCSFTGTESESWFLLISVAMEAKGAAIISTMLCALEAIKSHRDNCHGVLTAALNDLRDCICDVGVLLDRMYERCDPMTFYHRIRPFLAGSKNMAAAGLPRGVFYDEGDGRGSWRELRGGSNGQSSLIQFFDIVLGVDHRGGNNGNPDGGEDSFHVEVREYMPGPHRRLLVHTTRMGSIREFVAHLTADHNGSLGEEQQRLRAAYVGATEALTEFRNKHIRIVTRYIVLPSRQPWNGDSRKQNLASSSSTGKESQHLTGTGGTSLMPFLKQVRDETTVAGLLE